MEKTFEFSRLCSSYRFHVFSIYTNVSVVLCGSPANSRAALCDTFPFLSIPTRFIFFLFVSQFLTLSSHTPLLVSGDF